METLKIMDQTMNNNEDKFIIALLVVTLIYISLHVMMGFLNGVIQ